VGMFRFGTSIEMGLLLFLEGVASSLGRNTGLLVLPNGKNIEISTLKS
jgi:hypothetical protein